MEMVKSESVTAPFEGYMNLPLVRQLALMIGLAASIALVVVAVMWTQKGDYALLFSGLAGEDAAAVVDALQQQNIDYKMDQTTGAVMVPADKVHEVRLRLAGEGLPKSSGVGFDMLQKEQGFGTTQFIQNKRYQHALETELARTIATVGPVKSARVHLALPKQSVFVRERKEPSASVAVHLFPGRRLEGGQVDAITHLVASGIPELSPHRVTVVDRSGRLLSDERKDEQVGRSEEQFEYTRKLEKSYVERIENILSPIVGYEGVRAQVAADVDFSVMERTQETYNPDLPAPRSKRTMEEVSRTPQSEGVPGALSNQPPAQAQVPEQAAGQNQQGTESEPTRSRKETTVNYELDRTISHSRQGAGRVKRLSVAVVVNDRTTRNEDGEVVREPWPAEELQRIESLVREAVGYNPRRGDTVNVINQSFQAPEAVEPLPEPAIWEQPWVWDVARKVGGGIIVLLVILGLLRPLLRSLASVKPGPARAEVGEEELGEERLSLSGPEGGGGGAARLPRPEERYEEDLATARQVAHEEPKRVAQVVRTWLQE